MTNRSPTLKRDQLLELIDKIAFHHHDCQYLIVKSKTGFKVVFGALPDIEKMIPILGSIDNDLWLDDALHLALIQQPQVEDNRAHTLEQALGGSDE